MRFLEKNGANHTPPLLIFYPRFENIYIVITFLGLVIALPI